MVDPTGWIKKELLRLYPEADPRLQSAGTSPGIDLDGDGWINPAEEIGDLDGDGLAAGEADWELYFYRHADFLELLGGSFAHAGYFAADNIAHNGAQLFRIDASDANTNRRVEDYYKALEKTAENAGEKSGDPEIAEAIATGLLEGTLSSTFLIAQAALMEHFGTHSFLSDTHGIVLAGTLRSWGNTAMGEGDFETALTYYNEAGEEFVTLSGSSLKAYAYARLGNIDQAERELERAPWYEAGSEKRAVSNLNRLSGALAYIAAQRKDFADALLYYNDAIQLAESDTERMRYLTERGIVHFETGNIGAARKDFEAAFLLDMASETFFAAEISYHLGLIALKTGSPLDADQLFKDALLINNQDPRYQLGRGKSLLKMRGAKKALPHFQRAIALGMETAEVFEQAGIAQLELKDWKGALANMERCLEIEAKHGNCLTGRGWALSKLGRKEAAMESLNAAIEKVTDSEQRQNALLARGMLYLDNKNWEEAARDFEGASRLKDDKRWNAYAFLGHCRIQMGLYDKAIEALDRAIALNPSDVDIRRARIKALRKKLGLPEE